MMKLSLEVVGDGGGDFKQIVHENFELKVWERTITSYDNSVGDARPLPVMELP